MFMVSHPLDPTDSPWRRTVVVVPALNEAACVGETVRQWLALGVGRVRVVDNGSPDDTAGVARTAGAEVVAEPRRGFLSIWLAMTLATSFSERLLRDMVRAIC